MGWGVRRRGQGLSGRLQAGYVGRGLHKGVRKAGRVVAVERGYGAEHGVLWMWMLKL
jgi:hypothetical protein